MSESRHTPIELTYNGRDISVALAPYLLNFTLTDNAEGQSDDISITLEDRDNLWTGEWFPEKGATLTANIVACNWAGDGKVEKLPCGTFEIDQVECSGPPTTISIKAVSTLISKPARQEKHTKAWESVTLSTIASDIASSAGLKFYWDSNTDPQFIRKDQIEKADLAFLMDLCKDYGIVVKVTDTQLTCYNESANESRAVIGTIDREDRRVKSYRWVSKSAGTYKGVKLKHHDPLTSDEYETYCKDDSVTTGQDLEINVRAESQADAEAIAKSRLRQANKREVTGNLTLIGSPEFLAGESVTVTGWGKFDGKYLIDKATHAVSQSGYTTTLELRQTLKSKGKSKKKAKKSSAGGALISDGFDTYHK